MRLAFHVAGFLGFTFLMFSHIKFVAFKVIVTFYVMRPTPPVGLFSPGKRAPCQPPGFLVFSQVKGSLGSIYDGKFSCNAARSRKFQVVSSNSKGFLCKRKRHPCQHLCFLCTAGIAKMTQSRARVHYSTWHTLAGQKLCFLSRPT